MAGLIGIRAEDMEQIDAMQRLRADYPDGFPLVRPHVLTAVLVMGDKGLEARTARFGFSRRFASFNARVERLQDGRMWKSMFGRRHAIAPLSYVVEWVEDEDGRRPYLIQRRDGRPIMAPALLGHHHEKKEDLAFAICTRPPNAFFATFHDRMVGQCTPELMDRWLAPEGHDAEALIECVHSPDDEELVAVPAPLDVQKRKAGDWSPIPAAGTAIGWQEIRGRLP